MTHEDDNEDLEFTFDKFMDDILIKESATKHVLAEETPQRKYVQKYIERAGNRIKYTRVK